MAEKNMYLRGEVWWLRAKVAGHDCRESLHTSDVREARRFRDKRLKEIEGDKEAKDEAAVLNEWLKFATEEAALKKQIKETTSDLDAKAYAKYPKLTEAEIKTLVVDDKWLAALDAAIHGEMDRISQTLTQRVKDLAERYGTPMPQHVNKVAELEQAVNRHLERMGFSWISSQATN